MVTKSADMARTSRTRRCSRHPKLQCLSTRQECWSTCYSCLSTRTSIQCYVFAICKSTLSEYHSVKCLSLLWSNNFFNFADDTFPFLWFDSASGSGLSLRIRYPRLHQSTRLSWSFRRRRHLASDRHSSSDAIAQRHLISTYTVQASIQLFVLCWNKIKCCVLFFVCVEIK